jgi:hypothetical protein
MHIFKRFISLASWIGSGLSGGPAPDDAEWGARVDSDSVRAAGLSFPRCLLQSCDRGDFNHSMDKEISG